MIARVLVLVAAAGVLVFAVARHHEVTSCTSALRAGYHASDGPAARDVAARVRDHCRGSDDLANTAVVLSHAGKQQALVAKSVAEEAVHREPDNARAWLSLAFVLRGNDQAGALKAQAEASRLNRFSPVVVAP